MEAPNSSQYALVIQVKSAFFQSVPDSMKILAARYLNRLVPQIEPHQNSYQYPLINYPASICKAILAAKWNYEQQGADWTDKSGPGPCKSGKSQSPINLKNPNFDKNLKGILILIVFQ